MAKTTDTKFGYSVDTATDLTIASVPALDYENDFAVKEQEARSIVLTNTTSPMGWPETLKFQISDVGNVYNNVDIDPTLFAPSKKGKSVLVSLADAAKVTSGDSSVLYPIQCHMVIRFPNTSDVTVEDIMKVAKRNFAMLFDGADSDSRLGKLIHGALNPIQ